MGLGYGQGHFGATETDTDTDTDDIPWPLFPVPERHGVSQRRVETLEMVTELPRWEGEAKSVEGTVIGMEMDPENICLFNRVYTNFKYIREKAKRVVRSQTSIRSFMHSF